LNKSKIIGSPVNVAYQTMLGQLNQNNATYADLSQKYRKAKGDNDEKAMADVIQQMAQLDLEKQKLVTDSKQQNAYLGRIAAMNTYLSFLNADREQYQTGLQHYLGTIWQFTDFADEGYNQMNVVYEASANYANTLLTALPTKELETASLAYANEWPVGSIARMYALGGLYGTLSSRSSAAALPIAELLVNEYKGKYPNVIASVEKSFSKLRTSTPGAQAPDFSGPTPSGEMIALSDLKGKVVLLDFWASWCGPCRRENPNVVKMYEKYADKGFEILGVSLDKDKARWEKAIADDGLEWLHISDLKHWGSEYAALYGVRSIPDTILLDAEGKIIARNLRGKALEQRLEQLFSGK
jgi:peroxiredoxin